MAIVSYLPPIQVEIPHEPGEWMEFRKPASRVVKEARHVVESEGRRSFSDFGAEIVRVLMSGNDEDKAVRRANQLAKLQEYEPDQFDRATLLRSAIVRWSYRDPKTGDSIQPTPELIEQLDEPTAHWAHRTVVDMIRPVTKEADKSAPEGGASRT